MDGLLFYDMAAHREMLLKRWDDGKLWLFYQNPDGEWVSLREATDEDIKRLKAELDRQFGVLLSLMSS